MNFSLIDTSSNGSNATTTADVTVPSPDGPLYSLSVTACFTAFYALIFFVGFLGNVSTCLVIIKRQYMHSSTNFYLCNLAVSDLVILTVGLPTDVYYIWHPSRAIGGTWFCVFKGFITETASNASVLTIVTFTFERWINICHPFDGAGSNPGWVLARQNSKKIVRNIVLIWTLASLAAAFLSLQLGLVEIGDEQNQCNVEPDREIPYSFEISSVLFFVFPMTMITAFYLLIIVELRRTLQKALTVVDSPLLQSTRCSRQQAKASEAVVKILVAVVLAFFICFLPFHLQRLLATYLATRKDNEGLAHMSQILFMLSGVLYYFSTTANPFIYNIMSRRFRLAFKEVLLCRQRNACGNKSVNKKNGTKQKCVASQQQTQQRLLKLRLRRPPANGGYGATAEFTVFPPCPVLASYPMAPLLQARRQFYSASKLLDSSNQNTYSATRLVDGNHQNQNHHSRQTRHVRIIVNPERPKTILFSSANNLKYRSEFGLNQNGSLTSILKHSDDRGVSA